jgi:RND family efflux transporter MFP subunit
VSENRLRIILPIAILAIGVIGAVALIKSRAPVRTRPQNQYSPLVRIMEVAPTRRQLTVTAQGTVRPRTESTLVSEVSGRVIRVAPSFAAGGFFENGDVLVVIDPRDYELAVVTARSQVAQARVRAEMEEAQAKVAREEWAQLGDGMGSPLATRELQLEEARAALAAAVAFLEKAERDLARTRIRAPFAGRVREKLVDIGRFVSPGVPAASIFAIDYAEVRLPIPDADIAYLDLPTTYRRSGTNSDGPEVRLRADFAGQHQQWHGRIVRVEGEIDPVSRMVYVIAQVDDPYGRKGGKTAPLAVGLFVEAEIMGREVEDAVVIPRSAVRGGYVLIVDDEDRLRFREVDILRLGRDEAIVTSGLRAGDRVCVSPLEAVTDGMKVRTMQSAVPTESDSVEVGENP